MAVAALTVINRLASKRAGLKLAEEGVPLDELNRLDHSRRTADSDPHDGIIECVHDIKLL